MNRWDALFADLEAQAATLVAAERAAEVEERTRGEIGTLRLVDRFRAGVGAELRLRLAGGVTLRGQLARVGADWLLLTAEAGQEVLVPLVAVTGVRGLPRYSAVPHSEGVVASRLGLRHALRGVARDRSPVRLDLVDGTTVAATIDRVGADLLEVAAHPAGEPRRARDVHDVELIPLAGLAAVRRSV
jgi:hypothetical protein